MNSEQKQTEKYKRLSKAIANASEKSGKTYKFNEKHPKSKPIQMWFQNSNEGLILFVVFYTQACRWSRCKGCNLPALCSQFHVEWKYIIKQIDYVFSQPEVLRKRKKIRKLIISNNGSVLDEVTFSSRALMHLMIKVGLIFPNLDVICLETRPEYVDLEELEFLSRALEEDNTNTELAIGYEAHNSRIRNEVFDKGLTLKVFERFVKKVSRYKRYRIKCYFMQKPVPGMSDAAAIRDVQQGIDYLSKLSENYGVEINMHLNPTYAAIDTPLEKSFLKGDYQPPYLIDVVKAVLHAKNKPISVFVGLYDEERAVEGGSFIRKGDEKIIKELERFNRTQDYGILENLLR